MQWQVIGWTAGHRPLAAAVDDQQPHPRWQMRPRLPPPPGESHVPVRDVVCLNDCLSAIPREGAPMSQWRDHELAAAGTALGELMLIAPAQCGDATESAPPCDQILFMSSTSRVWPMRWDRAMACSSFLGFGSGSYMICSKHHGHQSVLSHSAVGVFVRTCKRSR